MIFDGSFLAGSDGAENNTYSTVVKGKEPAEQVFLLGERGRGRNRTRRRRKQ